MLPQETYGNHTLTKRGKSKISQTKFPWLKTENRHLFILFPNLIITNARERITVTILVNQSKNKNTGSVL